MDMTSNEQALLNTSSSLPQTVPLNSSVARPEIQSESSLSPRRQSSGHELTQVSSSCVVAGETGQEIVIDTKEQQKNLQGGEMEIRSSFRLEDKYQDSSRKRKRTWDAEDSHPQKSWDEEGEWPVSLDEEEQVMKEQIARNQLRMYHFSDETKEALQIPTSFQDATPAEHSERRALTRHLPLRNFINSFHCVGVRNLDAEDRAQVRNPSDLWFLTIGAPRLHDLMVEELGALAFLFQECGEDPVRLGLNPEELQHLLKDIISLHIDTMKTVASMQLQRACLATGRDPPRKQTDKKRLIISEKVKQQEVKQAEERLAHQMGTSLIQHQGRSSYWGRGLNRGAWRGTRRPRQPAGFRLGNGVFSRIAWDTKPYKTIHQFSRGSTPSTRGYRARASQRGRGRSYQ